MIKDLMALLERFVTAVEVIAARLAPQEYAGAPTERVELALPPQGEVDYDALAAPGNAAGYKLLLQECEKRGIAVKPRTKGVTIAAMLKEWDAAHPAGAMEVEELADSLIDASGDDAFGGEESATQSEPDPFGDDTEEGEDEIIYTLHEVREALKKYMEKKADPKDINAGKNAVMAIIKEVAGVDTVPKIPEDKFAAIMKAIA